MYTFVPLYVLHDTIIDPFHYYVIMTSEGQKCALYGMSPIMASQNEQQLSTSGTLESGRMALILLATDN